MAAKGIAYGKPKSAGINQLKFQRSIQSVAEERVGRACGGKYILSQMPIFFKALYKREAFSRKMVVCFVCQNLAYFFYKLKSSSS